MLSVFLLFGAMLASPATFEAFTFTKSETDSVCSITVGDHPRTEPPPACADAIEAARDAKAKAKLLYAWAFSLNEAGATRESLPWLDKAIALAPNFTNARHERAYTLNDLGFYERALVDADRNVALKPESGSAYSERAFARHRLGNFEGILADLRRADLLGEKQPANIVADLMWLGRYAEAAPLLAALRDDANSKKLRAQLERRIQFKPDGKEAERCELDDFDGDRAAAQRRVDDCSWAFDHETKAAKRADYLTVRAVVTSIAEHGDGPDVSDMQIAAGIAPEQPRHHMNYGSALVAARRSWAGREAYNRALGMANISKRDRGHSLAGRGRANFNLDDLDSALRDANESFALEPSAINTRLIGDIFDARGDKLAAKQSFMAAYRLGARDDGLIESLKKLGVADPAKEPK